MPKQSRELEWWEERILIDGLIQDGVLKRGGEGVPDEPGEEEEDPYSYLPEIPQDSKPKREKTSAERLEEMGFKVTKHY